VLFGTTNPSVKLTYTQDSDVLFNFPAIANAMDCFVIPSNTIPVTLTSTPIKSSSSCPGAPPQRMTLLGRGYVCTKSDSLHLRSSPMSSANVLTSLSTGTQFTVTDGPSCSDNSSWWYIQTDSGIGGWVSEGGDNIDPYFICPSP